MNLQQEKFDQERQHAREKRLGVAFGMGSYFVWGFFPLFFKQLAHLAPLEVLAHRIVWSMLMLLAIVACGGGLRKVAAILRQGKSIAILALTTTLIATNWFVFLLAVDRHQVLESSLGYFINPLISVLLGVVFLGERLRRLQVISLVAAVAGVAIITIHHGSLPWMALVLAVSFGLYGLLRKVVPVDALSGLFLETLLLFPLAAGYLLFLSSHGPSVFLHASFGTKLLLMMAGFITAFPLLGFAASAKRLRLTTVGIMQYLTPSLHFLLAVLVFAEPLSSTHLLSFVFIWLGLALFSYDAVRGSRPRL